LLHQRHRRRRGDLATHGCPRRCFIIGFGDTADRKPHSSDHGPCPNPHDKRRRARYRTIDRAIHTLAHQLGRKDGGGRCHTLVDRRSRHQRWCKGCEHRTGLQRSGRATQKRVEPIRDLHKDVRDSFIPRHTPSNAASLQSPIADAVPNPKAGDVAGAIMWSFICVRHGNPRRVSLAAQSG
jgi:hypothetical protein